MGLLDKLRHPKEIARDVQEAYDETDQERPWPRRDSKEEMADPIIQRTAGQGCV